MLLGFKTELNPNNKQRTMLAKSAGLARYTYNCRGNAPYLLTKTNEDFKIIYISAKFDKKINRTNRSFY
ncbi:helix-turn-helix domain-containing protein [Nostoc sp. WHI]|uniref:helix-turn-helix domain-containing protein n=1 Tax=Nostoc sp. WHI TaxID=2650611 RepID=UPI0018C70278|nr:helix-turn-helix domain-containing protein [Nostoc sp. WHI]